MSKGIVILGCNGQVGRALQEIYPKATALGHQQLDIADEEQVLGYDWSGVDVIINAAAFVNADGSETRDGRTKAWQVNAVGPRNLVKVALEHDITLVHYSSDYVFDGTNKNHGEDESLSPLSVYGDVKAAGDLLVSLAPRHYVLRVSWVIGDGHNFPRTMKRLADMRINPKVVNDQYGRPTFASEIARATKHLIDTKAEYGLYHVSNSGPIKSWAELAEDVFEYAGHDRDRVVKVSTQEYSKDKIPFAPRPMYSDMNLSKLHNTGFISESYQPLLENYVKNIAAVE